MQRYFSNRPFPDRQTVPWKFRGQHLACLTVSGAKVCPLRSLRASTPPQSSGCRDLIDTLHLLANGASGWCVKLPPRERVSRFGTGTALCFATVRENMPHLVKTIQLYWRDLSEGALCAGLSHP